MAGEKSENLYKALQEADPSRAPELVHKYNVVTEGIDSALINGDEDMAKQAKDHLKIIADNLIYQQKKADLIESFEQELDTIAESLGIAVSVPTDIEVADERAVGFAERYKESELRGIFDSYSAQEWKGIIDTMLKEGSTALDIPKERQYRVEQLNAVIIALEAIKKKIDESKGVGEDVAQLFEFESTTKDRAGKINNLIETVKRIGVKEIVQNGLTVEQLFSKYNTEFGDKIKNIFRSNSETEAFLDRYGRMIDITDEKKKEEYYLALVKFLRDQSDYQTAQNILEEIMSDEFKMAIDVIPGNPESKDTSESNVKGRLYDEADAKIGKLVTDKVIAQWRKEGMTREQIEDSKRNLRNMHYERLLREYAAEHILIGDLDDAEKGHKSVMVIGNKKVFWEQYNDMLDPKGEAFNLTDESWDMVLEELVYSAPLIIVSGGVAGAVAKGLSYAARAALAATRMATWGARLARGGRIAKAAYRLGKLSAYGTNLLIEGAVFELTFEGIQGELIFAQEDWVKKILWTSAALGLFKGAGKLGGKGAEALNKALAEFSPKLADKNLVQLINKLVVIGHTQVAAMLLLGAVQNMAAGQFEEFWNNFGYQIFHAYVAIGALNVAHGVISTTKGTIFRPKGGTSEAPKEAAAPKKTVSEKVTDAMRTQTSQSIEVSRGKDLMEAMDALRQEGFQFEINEAGEAIARKGGVEIHLKEVGSLKRTMQNLAIKVKKLDALLQQNGGKIDGNILTQFLRTLRDIMASLKAQGLPKTAVATASLFILSGCEAIESVGGGVEGLIKFIPVGAGLFGIIYGGIVGARAVLIGRSGINANKARASANNILGVAETAQVGADIAARNAFIARINQLRGDFREFRMKMGNEYTAAEATFSQFEGHIIRLITEIGSAIPRQDQINTHLEGARIALQTLLMPTSGFWSHGNALRLSLGAISILAALYVLGGSKVILSGHSDDDDEDIPNIPLSPGGGGEKGEEGDKEGKEIIVEDDGETANHEEVETVKDLPSNLKDNGFYKGPNGELLREGFENEETYDLQDNGAVLSTDKEGKQKILPPGMDPEGFFGSTNFVDYIPRKDADKPKPKEKEIEQPPSSSSSKTGKKGDIEFYE